MLLWEKDVYPKFCNDFCTKGFHKNVTIVYFLLYVSRIQPKFEFKFSPNAYDMFLLIFSHLNKSRFKEVCSTQEDTTTTNRSAQKLVLIKKYIFLDSSKSHRSLQSPKSTESQGNTYISKMRTINRHLTGIGCKITRQLGEFTWYTLYKCKTTLIQSQSCVTLSTYNTREATRTIPVNVAWKVQILMWADFWISPAGSWSI